MRKRFYLNNPKLKYEPEDEKFYKSTEELSSTNEDMFNVNTQYRKQSLDQPIGERLSKAYGETILIFAEAIA